MRYKTYKGKPTKYQSRRFNQHKGLILIIIILILSFGWLYESKKEPKGILYQEQTESVATGQIEGNTEVLMIGLSSVNPEAEQEVWEASFKACKKHGIDTYECASDLVAMAGVETGGYFNFKAVGDGGLSKGILQIHQGYHPDITDEQAFDPYFSADWTLARMINNGYKEDRDLAVRLHNGGINWRTLAYLKKVDSRK
ncbi:MAG: hypothetical protein PF488_04745 [Patescibacteria group bacterium]|jgi:hypothetical protein|nr:hypothetical protein [Patescibacteria group bacterium]